jgi:hypothetical protein
LFTKNLTTDKLYFSWNLVYRFSSLIYITAKQSSLILEPRIHDVKSASPPRAVLIHNYHPWSVSTTYSVWPSPGHFNELEGKLQKYFLNLSICLYAHLKNGKCPYPTFQSQNTVKPLSIVPGLFVFPDPSFNFYGPWVNPISTMAPASIVFPDPLFLFQTPYKNDE